MYYIYPFLVCTEEETRSGLHLLHQVTGYTPSRTIPFQPPCFDLSFAWHFSLQLCRQGSPDPLPAVVPPIYYYIPLTYGGRPRAHRFWFYVVPSIHHNLMNTYTWKGGGHHWQCQRFLPPDLISPNYKPP